MPKKSNGKLGVKQVLTNSLIPNPHNPRMLFDKQPMDVLRASIQRSGILVPLIVYRDPRQKRYVILDGQRRWMCAQDVGIKTVAINEVREPSLVQNIVTMFHIHKHRADWDLMPTALKIEVLINEIDDKNNSRLAELTGLDEAVIVRCKKLLSFDRKYQDMMLDPVPEKRVKADFFIELFAVLHDREVKKFSWFSENKFTDQMLAKYRIEPRTIRSVTDFRVIKQHVANASRANAIKRFSKRLETFAGDHASPISILEIAEASLHAEAKAIVKKISSLEAQFTNLDPEQFYGEEALWTAARRLITLLESKLTSAGKRKS